LVVTPRTSPEKLTSITKSALPCAKLKENDELHPQGCPNFGGRLQISWEKNVSLQLGFRSKSDSLWNRTMSFRSKIVAPVTKETDQKGWIQTNRFRPKIYSTSLSKNFLAEHVKGAGTVRGRGRGPSNFTHCLSHFLSIIPFHQCQLLPD
jgi:hypothetical protein